MHGVLSLNLAHRVPCVMQSGDDFTSELVRIHDTIQAEGGPRQPMCLAINRSDYMLHAPEDGTTTPHLLQVPIAGSLSSDARKYFDTMCLFIQQEGEEERLILCSLLPYCPGVVSGSLHTCVVFSSRR